MSKTLWVPSFVATACLVTASLAAQAPTSQYPETPAPPSTSAPSTPTQERAPAPSTPTSSAAASQSANKKITLSGCVARQPEGASAAAGAASMPFSLTNAAAVAASAPVGTAGASAAAPASIAKTYRLDGAESMISPHVGHKVEVTGTVDDQPSATASASASGATASASNAPKLKIDSVKMVAATCP
jgi:hypothetical protein